MNKIYITFLCCLFPSKHTNNSRMLVILEQLIINFVSFSSSIIIIFFLYCQFLKFKSEKGLDINKNVPQWTEKIVGDHT